MKPLIVVVLGVLDREETSFFNLDILGSCILKLFESLVVLFSF